MQSVEARSKVPALPVQRVQAMGEAQGARQRRINAGNATNMGSSVNVLGRSNLRARRAVKAAR